MRSLAQDKDPDASARNELVRARIPVVPGISVVMGKLGPIEFTRGSGYWIAAGPVPIELARELYADPVGETDIRAGGHCARLSPDEYVAYYEDLVRGEHAVDWYHIDSEVGLRIFADAIRGLPA